MFGIIFLSHYFSLKSRILRSLSKTQSISPRKAQNKAYVTFVGKALNVKTPLYAPISGRPCIFYQILVEIKRKNWNTLIDQTEVQDFFIDKNGEMVMVKMDQPQAYGNIYLKKDHKAYSDFLNDFTNRLDLFLKQHGKSSTGLFGLNNTLRYKEGIIAINELVAVQGIAQWKSLSEPIDGFSYSKILTLYGTQKQKLLITDLKKATVM